MHGAPSPTAVDCCVVGAGVAGLRVAALLARQGASVEVVEAAPRAGGRVRTERDGEGRVLYEAGPWRIPSDHARAIALFREHGVRLVPLRTPLASHVGGDRHAGAEGQARAGLSGFDVRLLRTLRPHEADRSDQETGYAGQTSSDSTAAPYVTGAASFFVAPEGFSSLVDAMVSAATAAGARLRLDTRVTDVRRLAPASALAEEGSEYALSLSSRGAGGAFAASELRARAVFVCVPPRSASEWTSFAPHVRSHLGRVEEGCLHHVYVKGSVAGPPLHVIDASTPLVQTIGDQYGRGWMQASYTSGRMARFWHRLRMLDPPNFVSLILSLLRERFPRFCATAAHGGGAQVRSHFKEGAFHAWRPAPHFRLRDAVRASATPAPSAFPALFWAGEAFSSYQAWIEGALETAALAVGAWEAGGGAGLGYETRRPFADEVVVEGRVLGHMAAWATSHPGGAAAIHNHLGEDLTPLLAHVGHSPHAWAVVAALQTAWAE
jgi:hypothetical protein